MILIKFKYDIIAEFIIPGFSRLNTDVKNFIPVELNCIMQRYAYLLKKWNTDLDPEAEKKFQEIFDILTKAINRVRFLQFGCRAILINLKI